MTGFGGFGFLLSPSSERCWSLIHSCAEGEGFFLSLMGIAFKPCSCSHFIVRQPLLFPVLLIGNPQFVGAACVSQSWLTGVSVHSLYFTGLPFYSQFMAISLNQCLKQQCARVHWLFSESPVNQCQRINSSWGTGTSPNGLPGHFPCSKFGFVWHRTVFQPPRKLKKTKNPATTPEDGWYQDYCRYFPG